MTDRANAIVVTLDKDIRVDDVQLVLDAIKMIKGVLTVKVNVADITDHVAYMRARHDIQSKLFDALKEKS